MPVEQATSAAEQQAYIGLGANLGDPLAALRSAVDALKPLPGTRLLAVSSVYRTAPVDASGPDFLNAVAMIATGQQPLQLLDALQAIERQHGRQRPFVNAPRTLDLDLLLYGDLVLHSPRLTLPHPRMRQRAFVLRPLLELSPALVVPGSGALANDLQRLGDQRVDRCGPLMP
jgi:2-amino-4-hydroxy-6-hydroxymethyldihydropteridine diphosphokinase